MDRVKKTFASISHALNARPVLQHSHEGQISYSMARYLCQKRTCHLEPTGEPVAVFQLGGKQVSPGNRQMPNHVISYPSMSTILPNTKSTDWEFHGMVDMVVFVFTGAARTSLVQALAGQVHPVNLNGPLGSDIAMQIVKLLLRPAQEAEPGGEVTFLDHLSATLLSFLLDQLSRPPDRDAGLVQTPHLQSVQMALAYIDKNLDKKLTIAMIAEEVGLHSSHFRHIFKRVKGQTVRQYILECRMEKALRLLNSSDMPIARIAFHVGFNSQSHMTTTFKNRLGLTPRALRTRRISVT